MTEGLSYFILQKQATKMFSEEICDEFASNHQKVKPRKQFGFYWGW